MSFPSLWPAFYTYLGGSSIHQKLVIIGDCWQSRGILCHNKFVVRHIVKGTKVTAQFSKNLEPSKIIYICVDWHFICSMYLKYSGVFFNSHFSTHAILDSLLCCLFPSLNLLLSFSLSLFCAHTPLCFYLPLFNIKGYWFCMIGIIE